MSILQDYITKQIEDNITKGIYDSTNLLWVKTVKDHKDILVDEGSFIEIVEFEKNISFRYNLKNFIDTKIEQKNSNIKDKNAYWIIMILNNFKDDTDFINKNVIYVPNETTITGLYNEFNNAVLD